MRAPAVCVSSSPPQQARIIEQEMAVAKQRLGEHFHEATNTKQQ
jgi:hypothetical protein